MAEGAALEFRGSTHALAASSFTYAEGRVQFGPSARVTVAGGYYVAETVIGNTGVAAFDADADTGRLTLESGGTLAGGGTLAVDGPLVWSGGTMGGGGRTVARGGLRISGATHKYFDERTLDNEAAAVWSGGYVHAGLNRAG